MPTHNMSFLMWNNALKELYVERFETTLVMEAYRGFTIESETFDCVSKDIFVTRLNNKEQQWNSLESAKKFIDRYLMEAKFSNKLKDLVKE